MYMLNNITDIFIINTDIFIIKTYNKGKDSMSSDFNEFLMCYFVDKNKTHIYFYMCLIAFKKNELQF